MVDKKKIMGYNNGEQLSCLRRREKDGKQIGEVFKKIKNRQKSNFEGYGRHAWSDFIYVICS